MSSDRVGLLAVLFDPDEPIPPQVERICRKVGGDIGRIADHLGVSRSWVILHRDTLGIPPAVELRRLYPLAAGYTCPSALAAVVVGVRPETCCIRVSRGWHPWEAAQPTPYRRNPRLSEYLRTEVGNRPYDECDRLVKEWQARENERISEAVGGAVRKPDRPLSVQQQRHIRFLQRQRANA